MPIAFLIWSLVALIFILLGIGTARSKRAAGFWSGVQAPRVKDIRRYNRDVARLWFVFALIFELLGIPLLRAGQNSPAILVTLLTVPAACIGLMIAYTRVEHRHRA